MLPAYSKLTDRLLAECQLHYGSRLVSLIIFGSVARGTAGPESDLDLLVVAEGLPVGRIPRVEDFAAVERRLETDLRIPGRTQGPLLLAPVFKTPDEVRAGSLLFLDMIEDRIVLTDRSGFFGDYLDGLACRLDRLGARKVPIGDSWYWDLKPDYRYGDLIEL
jgi:hypothetical protein